MLYQKWGISLTNCKSFNTTYPKLTEVKNNYIIIPNGSAIRYGIKAAACDRIEIAENNIRSLTNPTSADITKVIGISLRQTKGAKIMDNYLRKMGSGIMTNGAMYNTQFYCNTMSRNYNGFY